MEHASRAGATALSSLIAVGLFAGCGEKDAPDDAANPVRAPGIARIVPASEAIAGAHIPTLDPVTMLEAEIQKVLGPGPRCEFLYTIEGRPVFAASAAGDSDATDGVVKLNGHLVTLRRISAEPGSLAFAADNVRLTVTPDGGEETGGAHQREASVVFEIHDNLRAGYRGYYHCIE